MMLKHNRTRDQSVQANTHTQIHMTNIWSEMVTLTPCLALYCIIFPWFIQCIWDISTPNSHKLYGYSNLICFYTFENYNPTTMSNLMPDIQHPKPLTSTLSLCDQ